MNRIKYLLLAAIPFFMIACNNNEDEGFEVIDGIKTKFFVRNEDAPKPVPGDILLLKLKYTTADDSVIFDSKDIPTFKMRLNKSNARIPTIDDALAMLHVGDSAEFIIDAESFYVVTKKGVLPKQFKRGDILKFYVKLDDILTKEKLLEEEKKKEVRNEKIEESEIKRYITLSNIKVKPDKSGIYYIEKTKGHGPHPEAGDRVTVNYVGTFLSGQPFDDSYERGEPFTFIFGVGQVIQGWDIAIKKMQVGTKATVIIPSRLAYGSEGYGNIIPPFTPLIFDIEVMKIQKNNKTK